MILGSHNSWSYLPVKHWWIRPFSFIYKCQRYDIKTQYERYKVRCFDLRVRFDNEGNLIVAHGYAEFKISHNELLEQLDWIDSRTDCYLRVIHEVRNKKQYTSKSKTEFRNLCQSLEYRLKHTRLWCGKNLYNWENDYYFDNSPSCTELYSSVLAPNWDTPKSYAKLHNKINKQLCTNSNILLIDYVDIE